MNIFKRFLVVMLITAVACPSNAEARRHRHWRKAKGWRGVTAASAMVWDVTNNQYRYARNIDRQIFPASTTKVMTVLLALERLSLDQYVTVNENATKVQPTKLDARPGEQYKVRDLIYAMLLKSANDAAVVLAEAVAGSQSQFVALMNQRAVQLGALHTHFANAHGLPSDGVQYSTARDMGLIFKEAYKNPFFRQAITFKYRIIYSKDGRRSFLKTHNKALFLNWHKDIYGKTGYTREAQSCFVGTFNNNNNLYIVDVFGCHKRWEDLKYIVEHYTGANL